MPLDGRRLVVTRAANQAEKLVSTLTACGAEVLLLPMVAITGPSDGGFAIAAACARFEAYDRIIVTSPNGARSLLETAEIPPPSDWPPVAVIGPATAEPLLAAGIEVDLIPKQAVAESLINEFPKPPKGGGRILLIRAESARSVLPESLIADGWDLDEIPAYRNIAPDVSPSKLNEARSAEAVIFTAASAVNRYHELIGEAVPVDALCIGPITATTAQNLRQPVSQLFDEAVS